MIDTKVSENSDNENLFYWLKVDIIQPKTFFDVDEHIFNDKFGLCILSEGSMKTKDLVRFFNGIS